MRFTNREEAAIILTNLLKKYKDEPGVILAVPRGGVPIGYIIAKYFKFPLEILLTKKIPHPESPELAIGAVSLESHIIDDQFKVPQKYIEDQVKKIRESLKIRYRKFMGDRKPANLFNKTVIVVDDGIATGNTILVAIDLLKQKNPKNIIIAVPVAPQETINKIKNTVDKVICIYTPENFFGVGQFYTDFSEVSDEEVIELLNDINKITTSA